MHSMIAIGLLLLAFGVLVGTFLWIAHLLAEREKEKKRKARAKKRKKDRERAELEESEEGEEFAEAEGGEEGEADTEVDAEDETVAEAQAKAVAEARGITVEAARKAIAAKEVKEQPEMVRGRGYGSNYGLLLGALSCGLFWMSPLVMALSFVGGFYCGRAIVNGLRHFRIVIWRAVIGLLLCFAGIALQLMTALGMIPALV